MLKRIARAKRLSLEQSISVTGGLESVDQGGKINLLHTGEAVDRAAEEASHFTSSSTWTRTVTSPERKLNEGRLGDSGDSEDIVSRLGQRV